MLNLEHNVFIASITCTINGAGRQASNESMYWCVHACTHSHTINFGHVSVTKTRGLRVLRRLDNTLYAAFSILSFTFKLLIMYLEDYNNSRKKA